MAALDLHQYGEKVDKIFSQYREKLDKRAGQDITATRDDIDEQLFNADPTNNKAYLEWIVDSYINGGIALAEDLPSRVNPALEDYHYLKTANKLDPNDKIITNFCGIIGCTKKFKIKMGLEGLLTKYSDALEHRKEKVQESVAIRENTILIFETDELTILSPKTEEASCYYGRGTRWCTAATRGENRFDWYTKDSPNAAPLYIVIPKQPKYEGEKYQLQFVEKMFCDEKDVRVLLLAGTHPRCLLGRFPTLKEWDLVSGFQYGDLDLTLQGYDLTTLDGVILNDGITSLNCRAKQFTSLPILPKSLVFLRCSHNQLTTLPDFPSNLKIIHCKGNKLSFLPMLPSNLEDLSCSDNQLASLPRLSSTLTDLSCSNNKLTYLPTLSSTLEKLKCSKNQLTTLPNFPQPLKKLDCSYNELIVILDLPQTLVYFNCSNNKIIDFPELLSTLDVLDCSNNQLIDLPDLPLNLRILYCSNNKLLVLPELPSTLTTLQCYNNKLTYLPTLPSTLDTLDCSNNHLTSLPKLPSSLRYLKYDNNPLSPIILKKLSSLNLPTSFSFSIRPNFSFN